MILSKHEVSTLMQKKQKIIILTSRTGGGHISIANALKEQLEDLYDIIIFDPQPNIVRQHYKIISREAQWIWSAEYRSTNHPKRALLTHKIFARALYRKLSILFHTENPDLIISTHPLLTYEVKDVLKKMHVSIPFALIFTDPANIHWTWFSERNATATFAPTKETYLQAIGKNFDSQKLFYVGWPIRKQFKEILIKKSDHPISLQSLNLASNLFTIFFQGGGEGSSKFEDNLNLLLEANLPIQIILACGSNEKLYKKYANIPHLFPLSYTSTICQYMNLANVIMGKAGPNVLFESVTMLIPFIATTFLPAQEEANLNFINVHNLGWVALTLEEQIYLLKNLIHDPSICLQKKDQIKLFANSNNEALEKIPQIVKAIIKKT